MTIQQKVEKILDEPILGHPSRDDSQRIKKLEKAVMLLAKEASYYNR